MLSHIGPPRVTIRGFFIYRGFMNKIAFLVDGFNLYHSVVDASLDLGLEGKGTKWLNIYDFCSAYLHLLPKESKIEKIYYFSAYAYHLQDEDPHKVGKHKNYIKCLKSTGIEVQLGNFKPKRNNYRITKNIKITIYRNEEKETDVAIAAKLFEILIKDEYDTVVILTGDTDLKPAVMIAKNLFPKISMLFALPYKRQNRLLKELLPQSFSISKEQYTRYQFPDEVKLSDGTIISKPDEW